MTDIENAREALARAAKDVADSRKSSPGPNTRQASAQTELAIAAGYARLAEISKLPE